MLLIISTVQKLLKGLTKKKGAKNKTKRAWSQKNDKEKKAINYMIYVKWKGYVNSFYSWIDKKDIV